MSEDSSGDDDTTGTPARSRRTDGRRDDGGGLLPRLSVDDEEDDGGIDRRRLIKWVALLAFAIPVVIEILTFGGLVTNKLFDGGGDDGVGVGDELLPETAATETVVGSDVRGSGADRTYVLRVAVENGTASTVELRLRTLELADARTVESVASTGRIEPGESGEVTGAWSVGRSRPEGVGVTALQDGEVVHEGQVPLASPD